MPTFGLVEGWNLTSLLASEAAQRVLWGAVQIGVHYDTRHRAVAMVDKYADPLGEPVLVARAEKPDATEDELETLASLLLGQARRRDSPV